MQQQFDKLQPAPTTAHSKHDEYSSFRCCFLYQISSTSKALHLQMILPAPRLAQLPLNVRQLNVCRLPAEVAPEALCVPACHADGEHP